MTEAPKNAAGTATSETKKSIRAAVQAEKKRLVAELKSLPSRSQITHLACEEAGPTLPNGLACLFLTSCTLCGLCPKARYLVYRSIQPDWWASIDIADASQ
jgi:hypothetical protein